MSEMCVYVYEREREQANSGLKKVLITWRWYNCIMRTSSLTHQIEREGKNRDQRNV